MSTEHICGLLAVALLTFVGVFGLIHHYRGERCRRCGARREVTHEGAAVRCRACGSQFRDDGHGWG